MQVRKINVIESWWRLRSLSAQTVLRVAAVSGAHCQPRTTEFDHYNYRRNHSGFLAQGYSPR
mgnify:CR=1 FL=1